MRIPFAIPASVTSVDVVIYTASLVSNVDAVDPILDDLRVVTSRMPNGKAQLSPADEEVVGDVYARLESYLTQRDPQRIFTPEELRKSIINYFANSNPAAQKLRRQLWIIGSVTAAVSAAMFLVPQAPTEDSTTEFYALLVVPTVFTMSHLGAAWLFGSALGYFRSQIKVAYGLIVAGIITLGLAQAQLVVIGVFDLWAGPWVSHGLVTLLYLPAMVLLYLGVRRFALAIGSAVPRLSLPFIVVLVVGVGFVWITPHAANPTSEFFYRFSAAGMAIDAAIISLAAISARRTLVKVTELYRRPLAWLSTALIALAVATSHILIVHLFIGYDSWYADYGIAIAPFLVSAVLLLKAGYVFKQLQTNS